MSFFDLVKHDDNTFITSELWSPFPLYPAFGGHLVSLSLLAAEMYADARPSSIHTYFLLPGKIGTPMSFEVKFLREGRTTKAVNIRGYQSNELIVTSDCLMNNELASTVFYKIPIEIYDDVYVHISTHFMNLLSPCTTNALLKSEVHKNSSALESGKAERQRLHHGVNEMIRMVDENYKKLEKYFSVYIGKPNGTKRQFKIIFHDKYHDFNVLMAFISDLFLCNTSLAWIKQRYERRMNGNDSDHSNVKDCMLDGKCNSDTCIDLNSVVKKSLDHKIHFHSNKFYDELIFVTECQLLGEKKALFEGKLLGPEGALVASVTQEGIITVKSKN
ncbi:Acyl-CoA thioesterase [Trachipleistophora hominis]|uniref:Acyl-CoA thioesterase n=1 Tax=Trachipleistophora hominis TaxID=72359 RepID=L7JXJ7_TRAHO|nr:Acyl-CoA thioesterase [Trachipleistophora hominis]